MKKQIFFFAFISLVLGGFSQNYRCINSSTNHYFEDSETIKAIHVDSVVIEGENQHYYIYPTFAEGEEQYCYTQYGPSWIGRKMTEVINGDNIFYNMEDEPIVIKTLSDLGDDWTCYEFASGNYITASCSEIQSLEFLGITDMVKKISFQTKDSSGSPISHAVNNMFLLLSENHGLIRTINFRVFPDLFNMTWEEACHQYELSGIEGNEVGVQNLTWDEIFNLNIGDEYHTEKFVNSWYIGEVIRELFINIIIDKEVFLDGDSLVYQLSRCGHKKVIDNYGGVEYDFYNDTVQLTYCKDWLHPGYIDSITDYVITIGDELYREYFYNVQIKNSYLNRRGKLLYEGLHSEYPHDCISEIIYDNKAPGSYANYYIEGLGGPYWNTYIWWEDYYELIYFYTQNEEWGEPLNCDSLMVNIKKPIANEQKVYFAPNPMTEKSTLKFPNPNHNNCTLILYNVYGNQVKEITTTGDEIIIEKENLTGGMYLYSLSIENGIIHSGKLIVH